MQVRIAAEKKPEQAPERRNKSTYNTTSPSAKKPAAKKSNVRTTDYRQMMQIFLTNPDSVTHEEFMFLQSAVGYRETLTLLEEGKKRKKLEKIGQSVPSSQPHIKGTEAAQLNKAAVQEPINRKVNNGIPDKLKHGIEKLSGVDLSDISVHQSSNKPEQLGALAYTQGKDIYLAPGQDKQLPHESWHAVQQKQGRVSPTLKTKTGTVVNDDDELEKEADIMGSKAESTYTPNIAGNQPENTSEDIPAESKAAGIIDENAEGDTVQLKASSSIHTEQPDEVIQKKDKNNSNSILDIIQGALDVIGFLPGLGDIADAVNTGIAIIRKQWLNAVFSAIALIPVLGSAIATPIKTLVRAAGNTSLIKKAVNLLASLLGGLKNVISKLSGLFSNLKGLLRKLPDLISSISDKFLVKLAVGKKGVNAIKDFAKTIRGGIETLCKKVDEVLTSIKKAFGKGTVKATGQLHHILTNKTMKALDNHPTLKGKFNREDPIFKYRAADADAHKGYQQWHRDVDNKVVTWLQNNPQATVTQFKNFLNRLYQSQDISKRIPNVNIK
ncbi:MAG: hypothetical protein K0R50_217 [Eubacterium sp.]|nr:hypothetical protein [Eubacterium sp.]